MAAFVQFGHDMPRNFMENLPSNFKLKADILSRYARFFMNLLGSPSPEVAFMAAKVGKDLTTVTGRNLKYIEDVTKFDPLITSTQMLREELRKPEEVPESEKWVIEELSDLLELQQKFQYYGVEEEEMDKEEQRMLEEVINALCTN